jgi:hypothetical protein
MRPRPSPRSCPSEAATTAPRCAIVRPDARRVDHTDQRDGPRRNRLRRRREDRARGQAERRATGRAGDRARSKPRREGGRARREGGRARREDARQQDRRAHRRTRAAAARRAWRGAGHHHHAHPRNGDVARGRDGRWRAALRQPRGRRGRDLGCWLLGRERHWPAGPAPGDRDARRRADRRVAERRLVRREPRESGRRWPRRRDHHRASAHAPALEPALGPAGLHGRAALPRGRAGCSSAPGRAASPASLVAPTTSSSPPKMARSSTSSRPAPAVFM